MIFITGAEGFIGKYLMEELIKKDEIVAGYYKQKIEKKNGIIPLYCDVKNGKIIEEIIKKYEPDYIYHLAAQSYPTYSWRYPKLTIVTNVIGTINVFESVRKNDLDTKIFVACSSAEYGIGKDTPIKESDMLQPLHPYGVSKVAQDLLAYQYFKNFGIKCTRGRIFNTTGPGKIGDAPNDFAIQIIKAEKRKIKPVIYVGNLNPKRDFTDVRDMVKGIILATVKGKDGEVYNLCSGRAIRIKDILNMLIEMSNINIEIKIDKKKLRPSDEKIILGDNSKIMRDTGWKPEIPLNKTLEDILNFWRKRI